MRGAHEEKEGHTEMGHRVSGVPTFWCPRQGHQTQKRDTHEEKGTQNRDTRVHHQEE